MAMCFRDMAFCNSPCVNKDCRRKLIDLIRAEAHAWLGKEGAPIAVASFSGWCVEHEETPHD
jgi:hypothetical protein